MRRPKWDDFFGEVVLLCVVLMLGACAAAQFLNQCFELQRNLYGR